MKRVDWRVMLVRALPHAIAAGMVGVAWLSFRGGVEWGAPWGSLGLALLAVHLILRLAPIQAYQTAALVWSSSEMVRPSKGRTQHPWMSMVAMDINGCPCVSADIHGHTWKSKDFLGYP